MAASVRRAYLYMAIAGALSVSAAALARLLHPLLWMVGIPDATGWIETGPGQLVATPIFQNPGTPPPAQQVRDALLEALLVLAVVVPLLALHYWLLQRDQQRDPTARGAIERVILLDLMSIGFGAAVVYNAVNAAASWLQVLPGAQLLFYNPVGNQQATSLAYALGFGIPLLVTALERRRTSNPSAIAQRISWSLFVLPQAVLLVAVIVIGGSALQEIMQALALPAAFAPCFSGRVFCMEGPSMVATTSPGQALVVLAAFSGAVLLTRKDTGAVVGVIRIAILVGTATLLAIAFFGYWISWYLTFELPYLGQPNYSVVNVLGFEYGMLLAAVASLLWTVLQARRQARGADRAWARRVILMVASLPPLGALALGLVNVISMFVASASGAYFNEQARNIAVGQLCAALPLLFTVPLLAREWLWWRATSSGPATRALSRAG